ncbi:WXG100 family type VII secretion target [Pseudarthrobacter sp. S6]|uniref:WXG100 family type VII secretion target n=1 Tax=Pseudarthrobacter sp. S6 TaxID=3418420 RepID=UPI003CF3C856
MPIDSVLGPGQLRTLGSRLQAGAGEIEQQRSNLSRVLDSINWEGPDATHFRGEWSGTHTAALNQVIQALKDAGQKATKNANEQDQASR